MANIFNRGKELTEEELQEKIEKLISFFDEMGIDYGKYDPNTLPKIDFGDKKAYPNFDIINGKPSYNLNKWIETIKTIYYKEKEGFDRISSIKKSLQGWNEVETYDFLNWLKYYEGKNHLKYKVAQTWYANDTLPGYFLHINKDQQNLQTPINNEINSSHEAVAEELSVSEKKRIIEKQRSKIVGRLDSAEKLLRTPEGHLFAGKELEALIDIIFALKKKIQLVNKISSSTKLYEDMIIREANILNKKGFIKASEHLYKIAQSIPAPASPNIPNQGSGAVGGLPSVGPGMPQTFPDSGVVSENETGIDKFLDNMETGNLTDKEDILEVSDDLEVNDDELFAEAQIAPPSPSPNKPLEVKENEPIASNKDVDAILSGALANITVNDAINTLEDVAKIFKTREISRQLAIVDLILDKLDLSSYFPQLGEAQSKSLEMTTYVSTRIDDVLNKLRGVLTTRDLDLKGENISPETAAIRNKLKEEEDKEKNRKQIKKQRENSELDQQNNPTNKINPNIEVQEDLTAPPISAPAVPPPPKV